MTTKELAEKIKIGLSKSEIIFWYHVLMIDNEMTLVNNAIIDRFNRPELVKIERSAEKMRAGY